MKKGTIYTIGHSNHEIGYFLMLLQAHDINCIVDVRSIAASTWNPQYNKVPFSAYLKNNEVLYMHFSAAFGARQENPALQNDTGKVDFEKVQHTDTFQEGVVRLEKGIEKGYNIALMCAEAEPLDCHRFSMISGYLKDQGFQVLHILKDASLVPHEEMEETLMEKFHKKLPQPSLFEPDIKPQDQLLYAYRLHNQEIGWSKDTGQETEEA